MRKILTFIVVMMLLTIKLISCPRVPTIDVCLDDNSKSKVDSLWVYTDSTISSSPSILGVFYNTQLSGTLTCYAFENQIKIWIRLKNGKEFNSSPVKIEGDFNGFRAVVNDTSVQVYKTNYFQYLRYVKNILISFIFLFVFKILINISILKPINKFKYIGLSFVINLVYLIVLFLLLNISLSKDYYLGFFYSILGLGFIGIIFVDILLSFKIFAKDKKVTLIISSAILSNLSLFIFGFVLLWIINWYY